MQKMGIIKLSFQKLPTITALSSNLGWQKSTPQKKISGAHYLPCKSIVLALFGGAVRGGFSQSFWPDTVPRLFLGPLEIRILTCSVKGIGSSSMGQQVGVRIQGWWSLEQDRLLGDQWSKPIDWRNKQQELGDFLGGVISNILPSCRNLQKIGNNTHHKGGVNWPCFFIPTYASALGFLQGHEGDTPGGRYQQVGSRTDLRFSDFSSWGLGSS